MSDLQEIKNRIYQENKITEILEKLNCPRVNVEQQGLLITAQLPDGDNRRSIQIYCGEDETARKAFIRTRGIETDIYGVIGYILFRCSTWDEVKTKIYDIKKWVCNNLGWQEYLSGQSRLEKKNWNYWLHLIKQKRIKPKNNKNKNKLLDESVLDQYIKLPHYLWWQEGIKCKTQKEFGIGYDLYSERIIFPIYNEDGLLVGIKGRYAGKDQEQLDDVKYVFLYPCQKGSILYNWYKALPYIEEKKEVIVVESEKSVMKFWQEDIKNVVAIGGSELAEGQIDLLKSMGIGIDIVLAWDKDKDRGFILRQLQKFKTVSNRNVFVVFDKNDLLKDNDSPIDKGLAVWEKLYNEYKYKIKGIKRKC